MSTRFPKPVLRAVASVVGWVLTVLMLLPGCSRREAPVDPTPREQASIRPGPSPAAVVDDRLPREGGPEGYVGSESCRECHADQFQSWHRTYHRTMTQLASPETVRANFRNVVLTNDGTRFRLSEEGQALKVRLEKVDMDPGATPGAGTPALDTRVTLVTGSHHMQVFWMAEGSGNLQVGFPFTWLIPERRWVPRNSTFLRPPGMSHQSEAWNVTCSRCHSTAIEPRVDPVARRMDTRAAELGISCEACHGPGRTHVETRRLAGPNAPKPDPAALAREIVHPEKIDPLRASETCGFCHSMKWIDRAENWRQDGFRFRPGDVLAETTPLIQPDEVEQVPGLREYIARNPQLLEDFFWSDGMVRVSGREHNGLVKSPCVKGGRFSCLSCHSLHESEPADLLAANRQDARACTQCHERYRQPAVLESHTHHRSGSSGSDCYNCHMPHTTYGVLTAIRSHQISSPRVDVELATGRPNACNLCHLDRTLAWTAEHLERWYGQKPPVLDAGQRTVADSVRITLAGDAGQRALMAWHLGWEPARAASGSDWIAPYLGLLMDDPYAAVRCVAERSLRGTSGRVPAGYDYVVPPMGRPPAMEAVVAQWNDHLVDRTKSFPDPLLLGSGGSGVDGVEWKRLLGSRNERPVRLRE
jgi:predicted CXXCH cytochrome family protein